MFQWLRIVLIAGMTVTAVPVLSQTLDTAPDLGSATIEHEEEFTEDNHLILLSPLREIGGEIRSEKMARVAVSGYSHLYRLDEDSTLKSARNHFREWVGGKDARQLFDCDGRDCGRSNVWANDVFGQSKLYGRDENQHYEVYAWRDQDENLNMATLYTVTRGNLRDYLWLEHFVVEDEGALPVLDMGPERVSGPYVVPWENGISYRFDWTARMRDDLLKKAEDSEATVLVAVYAGIDNVTPLEEVYADSVRVGEAMQKLLEKMGVPRDRQKLIMNGPAVSPASTGLSDDRVELTVIGPAHDVPEE